ncbi:MAG: hypothetical protein EZS28_053002 [Streblomastix strix]|uniref:Uncharacterized protein n=1 Tax=Streblomastix strix TaxID=222440 RepID=A0A5J4RPL6_9EUKA|nr:MAG: hypothetical protein EZS28_053002 [Streblomastix strix]
MVEDVDPAPKQRPFGNQGTFQSHTTSSLRDALRNLNSVERRSDAHISFFICIKALRNCLNSIEPSGCNMCVSAPGRLMHEIHSSFSNSEAVSSPRLLWPS